MSRRQSSQPKPTPRARPYGRRAPQPSHHLMTVLRPDALEAVLQVMRQHNLSRSGAVHHLVRIGAGLPPLINS